MIKEIGIEYIHYLNQSLYTAEQTRALDKAFINSAFSGEGYSLMKVAGKSLFRHVLHQYPSKTEWLVLCGGGNNGGDGFVAALLAARHNIKVTVLTVSKPSELSNELKGEALAAYQDLISEQVSIQSFNEAKDSIVVNSNTVIIDALLGTGLSGSVRSEYQVVIDWINIQQAVVVAADVPSGLCADRGTSLGSVVLADQTLTFIGINKGLATGVAKTHTGRLFFDDLGLPDAVKSDVSHDAELLSLSSIQRQLFVRKNTDHKGDSGRALLIGGENGYSGAAILASEACLRSGVGLLTSFVGQHAVQPLLTRNPEVMVRAFDTEVSESLNLFICQSDAICIGPGLSKSKSSIEMVKMVLRAKRPTVLDADALNILAENPSIWHSYGHAQCIMTPHPMEAARLLGISVADIQNDRYKSAKELERKFNCTILLKGSGTLISTKLNNQSVCFLGNASLAVGGMGDVLSGVILAFLSKSKNCHQSAMFGALMHAYAAEKLSSEGMIGILPSDINQNLPLVINETIEKRID